jgi:hypothetical protein
MAELLKRYADRIINQIDEWWIPVQVFQYNLLEQKYKDAGPRPGFALPQPSPPHEFVERLGLSSCMNISRLLTSNVGT